MTTLWWVVVMGLGCSFSFMAGWVIRAELDRYNRHVYDVVIPPRKRVGA